MAKGNKGAMQAYNEFQVKQLTRLIEVTRTNLARADRQKVGGWGHPAHDDTFARVCCLRAWCRPGLCDLSWSHAQAVNPCDANPPAVHEHDYH